MLNALGLASLCMHVIFLKGLALLRKGIILFLIFNRILLKGKRTITHWFWYPHCFGDLYYFTSVLETGNKWCCSWWLGYWFPETFVREYRLTMFSLYDHIGFVKLPLAKIVLYTSIVTSVAQCADWWRKVCLGDLASFLFEKWGFILKSGFTLVFCV